MRLSLVFQAITIFFLPSYIVRFNIDLGSILPALPVAVYPTTMLEILIILTVAVTGWEFAQAGWPFEKLKTPLNLPVAIFLVAAILSTKQSFNLMGALGILKAYFVEPVLFFYCLLYIQRSASKFQWLIISLLMSGLGVALWGVLQKLTGGFSLAPHEIAQGRVSAGYNSANALALYLGPIVILAVTGLISWRRHVKLLTVLLLGLFIVVMVWTRSRGGMIAEIIALSIMVYAWLVTKINWLKKYWYVLPAVLLIIISIWLGRLYQNYNFIPHEQGPYTKGDTIQIRFLIWAGTINLLKDHPLTGAGLNSFKTLYTNQYRLPQFQEQFQYPHNLLLTLWTETGLLGLFGFVLVLVNGFSLVIRKLLMIRKNDQEIWGAAYLAILTYWFIHGLVDVPYFKNDLSIQFWVVMAMLQSWSDQVKG